MPIFHTAVYGKWLRPGTRNVIQTEHAQTGWSDGIPEEVLRVCSPERLGIQQEQWHRYSWREKGGAFLAQPLYLGERWWMIASRQNGLPEKQGGRFFHHAVYWATELEQWNWSCVPELMELPADPVPYAGNGEPRPVCLPLVEVKPRGPVGLDCAGVEAAARDMLPLLDAAPLQLTGDRDEAMRRFLLILSLLPAGLVRHMSLATGLERVSPDFALCHAATPGSPLEIPDSTRRAADFFNGWLREISGGCEDTADLQAFVNGEWDMPEERWAGRAIEAGAEMAADADRLASCWKQRAEVFRLSLFAGLRVSQIRNFLHRGEPFVPQNRPLELKSMQAIHLIWDDPFHPGVDATSLDMLMDDSLGWLDVDGTCCDDTAGLRFYLALRQDGQGAQVEALSPENLRELAMLPLRAESKVRMTAERVALRALDASAGTEGRDQWLAALSGLDQGWLFDWAWEHEQRIIMKVLGSWSMDGSLPETMRMFSQLDLPALRRFRDGGQPTARSPLQRQPGNPTEDPRARDFEIMATAAKEMEGKELQAAGYLLDALSQAPVGDFWFLLDTLERTLEIFVTHPRRLDERLLRELMGSPGATKLRAATCDLLAENGPVTERMRERHSDTTSLFFPEHGLHVLRRKLGERTPWITAVAGPEKYSGTSQALLLARWISELEAITVLRGLNHPPAVVWLAAFMHGQEVPGIPLQGEDALLLLDLWKDLDETEKMRVMRPFDPRVVGELVGPFELTLHTVIHFTKRTRQGCSTGLLPELPPRQMGVIWELLVQEGRTSRELFMACNELRKILKPNMPGEDAAWNVAALLANSTAQTASRSIGGMDHPAEIAILETMPIKSWFNFAFHRSSNQLLGRNSVKRPHLDGDFFSRCRLRLVSVPSPFKDRAIVECTAGTGVASQRDEIEFSPELLQDLSTVSQKMNETAREVARAWMACNPPNPVNKSLSGIVNRKFG